MKFHPDKNKTEGAEVIFQELSEAYSIIGDVGKKAEYDELFNYFYDLEHDDSDNHTSNEDSDYSDDFKNLKDDNEELDDETLFKVLKFLA